MRFHGLAVVVAILFCALAHTPIQAEPEISPTWQEEVAEENFNFDIGAYLDIEYGGSYPVGYPCGMTTELDWDRQTTTSLAKATDTTTSVMDESIETDSASAVNEVAGRADFRRADEGKGSWFDLTISSSSSQSRYLRTSFAGQLHDNDVTYVDLDMSGLEAEETSTFYYKFVADDVSVGSAVEIRFSADAEIWDSTQVTSSGDDLESSFDGKRVIEL